MFIVINESTVAEQFVFASVKLTCPAPLVPQLIVMVFVPCPVAIIPPVTTQTFPVLPVMEGVGLELIFMIVSEVVPQPAMLVSVILTDPVPFEFQSTLIELEPCPLAIVPPDTVHIIIFPEALIE